MSVGSIDKPLRAANDQPFMLDVEVTYGPARAPLQIAAVSVFLRRQGSAPAGGATLISLSVPQAQISFALGSIGVRADLSALPAARYDLEIKITDATGTARQVRGVVLLEAGLGPA